MASLILSQTLMDVLNTGTSVRAFAAVTEGFASRWASLFIAVLAQALLHRRYVYNLASAQDWGPWLSSGWNRGASFWRVSQASLVMPEGTSRSLVWLVLPEDLAWATLVLFKDLMGILSILDGGSSPWCVFWGAPLLNLGWVTVDTGSQLIWDHHHPWAVITEDTRGVGVSIGRTSTEVAVSLLLNPPVLLPT